MAGKIVTQISSLAQALAGGNILCERCRNIAKEDLYNHALCPKCAGDFENYLENQALVGGRGIKAILFSGQGQTRDFMQKQLLERFLKNQPVMGDSGLNNLMEKYRKKFCPKKEG